MSGLSSLRIVAVVAFAAACVAGYAGPDSPVPEGVVPRVVDGGGRVELMRPVDPRAPRPQTAHLSVADGDGDGFADMRDNCPEVPNDGQRDLDGDGLGDACDDDIDGDGIANGVDTCPQIPNCNQRDMDGDGLGDVCDGDADGDGIANWDDSYAFDPRSSSSINASMGRAKQLIDQALMKSILMRVMTTDSLGAGAGGVEVSAALTGGSDRGEGVKPSVRRKVSSPPRGGVARAEMEARSSEGDDWDGVSWDDEEALEVGPTMGSLRSGAFSQPDALLDEL